MTKRTVQTLGLMLLASPLIVVGCGGSSGNGDAGGTGGGGIKLDAGGGGTGGTHLDAGFVAPDTAPPVVDTGSPADAQMPVDTTMAPDAPLGPDAPPPVIDVALGPDVNIQIDAPIEDTRPLPVDTAAGEAQAVDTLSAIDTSPVATCTETTKFSGGAITADRTLTKVCSPYTIKNDIDVDGNATLTIEAGVVLRFDSDVVVSIGYNTSGKISATGTATDPIVFTSANATPGPGDWAGLNLYSNTMNGTMLSYVQFDYCGSNADGCLVGIGVKANRVTLDHLTFAHVGPGSDGILEQDRDSNFVISNCTFNGIPSDMYAISVYAQSFVGIDSTNVFGGNALVELKGDNVTTDTSWKNIGTTVAVTNDINVYGTATPTLTVAAGSIFKFAPDVGISIGYGNPGKLVLAGTAASKITLTSLATTPSAGDWTGIAVWDNSSAKITYSTISYAGSSNSSGDGAVSLITATGTLDVENSTVSYSATYGIGVPCSYTGTITNTGNTFTSDASGDVGPGPSTSTACM